jgi:hypothetical protein
MSDQVDEIDDIRRKFRISLEALCLPRDEEDLFWASFSSAANKADWAMMLKLIRAVANYQLHPEANYREH